MSVISFEEGGAVWGSSSHLIYKMLLYFLKVSGDREYLLKFKQSYDHGYNAVILEDKV